MTAADMSNPSGSAEATEKGRSFDLISAVVLSAAALCTAYASYEAELWDGEQARHYTEANALRVEASRVALTANQKQGADLMVFGSWLNAYASDETALSAFYRQHFRPEFSHAFEAWMATGPKTNPAAPPTPFAMPDYVLPEIARADTLEQRAGEMFENGENANRIGDSFVLSTVILANALFFGGINQVPHNLLTRKLLLAVSVISCIVGIVYMATLPLAP